MGNVYKTLGKAKVSPNPKHYGTRLVVELCENIHVHYRNIRLEFSDEEFYQFVDVIKQAEKTLREVRKTRK